MAWKEKLFTLIGKRFYTKEEIDTKVANNSSGGGNPSVDIQVTPKVNVIFTVHGVEGYEDGYKIYFGEKSYITNNNQFRIGFDKYFESGDLQINFQYDGIFLHIASLSDEENEKYYSYLGCEFSTQNETSLKAYFDENHTITSLTIPYTNSIYEGDIYLVYEGGDE